MILGRGFGILEVGVDFDILRRLQEEEVLESGAGSSSSAASQCRSVVKFVSFSYLS